MWPPEQPWLQQGEWAASGRGKALMDATELLSESDALDPCMCDIVVATGHILFTLWNTVHFTVFSRTALSTRAFSLAAAAADLWRLTSEYISDVHSRIVNALKA